MKETLSREAEPTQAEASGKSRLGTDRVVKVYSKRRVVNEASIEVDSGEVVGLLGPNGAGKTTTFYMIVGMIRPNAGRVYLEGDDVTAMPMYKRARMGIGYLPQEPSIFRGLSVEQNLTAVLETMPYSRNERRERLDQLLEELDITHIRKSMGYQLSGGERRRVEITRSLVTKPKFMLLDEPFAGIDPIAVGDIQNLIRHLTRRGIGVLITDHNVRETLGLIDRAYIIHSGRVLTEGRPNDIVDNADVRRVYLGDQFRL